jgi:hypothetical protein
MKLRTHELFRRPRQLSPSGRGRLPVFDRLGGHGVRIGLRVELALQAPDLRYKDSSHKNNSPAGTSVSKSGGRK